MRIIKKINDNMALLVHKSVQGFIKPVYNERVLYLILIILMAVQCIIREKSVHHRHLIFMSTLI